MFKLIPNSVWQLLKEEIEAKRAELKLAHERIDRLVEALGKKEHFPIVMPQADARTKPEEWIPSSGWFDNKPIQSKTEKKNPQ